MGGEGSESRVGRAASGGGGVERGCGKRTNRNRRRFTFPKKNQSRAMRCDGRRGRRRAAAAAADDDDDDRGRRDARAAVREGYESAYCDTKRRAPEARSRRATSSRTTGSSAGTSTAAFAAAGEGRGDENECGNENSGGGGAFVPVRDVVDAFTSRGCVCALLHERASEEDDGFRVHVFSISFSPAADDDA